jgi:xanthine phosphoribosyltransferase
MLLLSVCVGTVTFYSLLTAHTLLSFVVVVITASLAHAHTYMNNNKPTKQYIPMSSAINALHQTCQLTFALEYQKWLHQRLDDVTYGSSGSSGSSSTSAVIKLRDRVLKDGKVLPNNIVDVSAFMDSMVDVNLMDSCAKDLASTVMNLRPNKILTVATTGLVIALPMAKYLQVPCVYARKERNMVMANTYTASYSSKTVGKNRELIVAKSHLSIEDRVLIVDDFLSSGSSQEALLRIVADAGAEPVGVAILLEKVYESGRQSLSGYNIPIFSLCRIASVQSGVIQIMEEDGYNNNNNSGGKGNTNKTNNDNNTNNNGNNKNTSNNESQSSAAAVAVVATTKNKKRGRPKKIMLE